MLTRNRIGGFVGREGWVRLWDIVSTKSGRVVIWDAYSSDDGRITWVHFFRVPSTRGGDPRMLVSCSPGDFGERKGSLLDDHIDARDRKG